MTTYTMEKSYSSPHMSLKSIARYTHSQMKAQKRARSVKHAHPKTQQQQQPLKSRKSVSFSALANVSVREISREELNASWIQPEEYSEIEQGRKRCLLTIKRALLGEAPMPNPSEDSIHGLEQQLSPKQVLERKLKNMQYRRLLLEEQHAQRCCGVSDPQALQSLSELFSLQASRRAQRRALERDNNALAA